MDSDLDIRIERYRLSATHEDVWDCEWKSGQCVHRWLLVSLWKARARHLLKEQLRTAAAQGEGEKK